MNEWPRLIAFSESRAQGPLALATLVARVGSSYRSPGARLLATAGGEFAGCMSGGCLEEQIAEVAARVALGGRAEWLEIDTRAHFGCAGVLRIWVERVERAWLAEIGAALAERRVIEIETRAEGAEVFRERIEPRPRVLVIGDARDAEALARQTRLLGWETWRIAEDSADILARRFGADARTAVVIMTRHLGRDARWLRQVWGEPFGYIGLLGSRRRREEILRVVGEAGGFEAGPAPEVLHAPTGLDIGAETPEAVALAIAAEIHAVWRRSAGMSLREKTGAIHAPTECAT